jgi:hypothetical protein
VSESIPRVGALARWHEEMRRGVRGKPSNWHTWKVDDLWCAACAEKTAIEMEAQGDLDRARDFMAWALCRLHHIRDEWDKGQRTRAHETKAGKALLKKLRGGQSASDPTEAPVRSLQTPRRREKSTPIITRWA